MTKASVLVNFVDLFFRVRAMDKRASLSSPDHDVPKLPESSLNCDPPKLPESSLNCDPPKFPEELSQSSLERKPSRLLEELSEDRLDCDLLKHPSRLRKLPSVTKPSQHEESLVAFAMPAIDEVECADEGAAATCENIAATSDQSDDEHMDGILPILSASLKDGTCDMPRVTTSLQIDGHWRLRAWHPQSMHPQRWAHVLWFKGSHVIDGQNTKTRVVDDGGGLQMANGTVRADAPLV